MRRRSHLVRSIALITAVGGLSLLGPVGPAAAANPEPQVVPRVQEWTGGTGSLTLDSASRIVVDPGTAGRTAVGEPALLGSPRTLRQTAQRLHDDLRLVTGLDLPVVEATSVKPGDIALRLKADTALGDEGYELSVTDRVAVTAPATDGIFYAGQTLLQQLRLDPGHATITQGTIRDWPDIGYRAEHFDVSRRFMSVADIQDEIRRAAWNKLNVVQLMFNQANAFRLYSPDYAAAAPTDPTQRYSKADIAAIEAVAADYHVTVVPEIQNPTKMQPIAGLGGVDRSLAAQCGDPSTIDFTSTSVTTWFQGVVDEFAPWFDGPYIHLGNDEVPTSLSSCTYLTQQLAAGETIDDLQVKYIGALQSTVKSHGKQAMIWVNNTKIRPKTDVLIMNFGPTAVSDSMRDLGYDVVDSAYKTGPYDRFYIAPSDYERKVVPRGDIYAWTPAKHPHNAGQVLAMWGDDLYFSETSYFIDMFDGRRSELAERTWNTAPTKAGFAAFSALVDKIGIAPGVAALRSVPETSDARPIHAYDFNSKYTPSAATHYPGYWSLSLADSVGTLHASASHFSPNYPVAGHDGNGLGFKPAAVQALNLGGYRIDGPWSVALWLKRTANSTNTVLLRDMDHAIKVEQAGTANRIGLTTYGGSGVAFDYSAPLGSWVHLVLTSDGSRTRLYADGALVDSVPTTIPLPLGGIGGNRSFGGALDDLLVYAECLDAGEVGDLYGASGDNPVNLAHGKPASASSVKGANPERAAAKAFDGDPATRWGSEYADPQWVQVDLGSAKTITGVRLHWEAAYAKAYQIQVSDDARNWTTVYATTQGDGGHDEITTKAKTGRYVRMLGTQRGTGYGYSLWEMSVLGT